MIIVRINKCEIKKPVNKWNRDAAFQKVLESAQFFFFCSEAVSRDMQNIHPFFFSNGLCGWTL